MSCSERLFHSMQQKRGSLSPSGEYKLGGKEPGGASGRVWISKKIDLRPPKFMAEIKPGHKLWFRRKTDHKLSFAVFKSYTGGRIYAQFSDGVWSFSETALGKRVFLNREDAQRGWIKK